MLLATTRRWPFEARPVCALGGPFQSCSRALGAKASRRSPARSTRPWRSCCWASPPARSSRVVVAMSGAPSRRGRRTALTAPADRGFGWTRNCSSARPSCSRTDALVHVALSPPHGNQRAPAGLTGARRHRYTGGDTSSPGVASTAGSRFFCTSTTNASSTDGGAHARRLLWLVRTRGRRRSPREPERRRARRR
jgi:hypothetical protein